MRILISGSSGLVGRALVDHLGKNGHTILPLVRSAAGSDSEIQWDVERGYIQKDRMEGIDAVIHLAGENIAAGRWTKEQKGRILESRRKGTRLLSEAMAGLSRPPDVLLSSSAIGFYGDRGDELLQEKNPSGTGFLSDVCREWEAATEPAIEKGIRVVHLRFGMILSSDGGALAKMLPAFRMGLGGRVGRGRQYVSWIGIDDAVRAIDHLMMREGISGPVNVVSPHPVRNGEFTKTLGRVLSRPTFLNVPAFALRILFGEMADALLLSSTRVDPARLRSSGFVFNHPDLEASLRHCLKRTE
ncbi:MAG: TIGR01777 family oxidoreductase [Pseudomonadota bacterium]